MATADADDECSSLFTSRRSSPQTPVKNYRTLHGIRGVAALRVVVLYSPRLFGSAPAFLAPTVDLFLVLSGFVLAHVYEDRRRRGMTPLAFLRQRCVRLYPLYQGHCVIGIGPVRRSRE